MAAFLSPTPNIVDVHISNVRIIRSGIHTIAYFYVAIYEYVVAYVSTVLPYIRDTNKLNGYLVLSLMPLIYHAVNVTHIR